MPRPRPDGCAEPQPRLVDYIHGLPAADGGRDENDAVDGRRARARHQDHDRRAAHAFAEEIKRGIGMGARNQPGDHSQIIDQAVDAGPQAAIRGFTEAALVIGISGDAACRPERRRFRESVGIIVEAMHRDDDGLGRAFRSPHAQAQFFAVGGENIVTGQFRSHDRRPGGFDMRRAGAEGQEQACRDRA